jgi:uncharacterized repeat protein (TIGR03803 family)
MKLRYLSAILLFAVLAMPCLNAQTYTVLHSFHLKDGQNPVGNLTLDAFGNVYGVTRFGGSTASGGENVGDGTVFEVTAAGTEKVLHSFLNQTDGSDPLTGLTPAPNGLFYGVSDFGGDVNCPLTNYGGCGTLFSVTPKGQFNVIHTFAGASSNDGAYPTATLFRDKSGNLYGTTSTGGLLDCANFNFSGCGTAFEMSPSGTESILYDFEGPNNGSDGQYPFNGLIEDSSGNFYGTTNYGGNVSCTSISPNTGCGTVFELSPNGSGGYTETILYRFSGGTDGNVPTSALILDAQGNLYGATNAGGNLNCSTFPSTGCGTIFKLTKGTSGWTESVLYDFPGGSDGASPGQIIRDSQGNFYGTVYYGGDTTCRYGGTWGCGAVFKVDSSGNETILHSFEGTDGLYPGGGLTLNQKTNTLYGNTQQGGDIAHCSYPHYYEGCGTVFKLVL